jgi:hypothetical protein
MLLIMSIFVRFREMTFTGKGSVCLQVKFQIDLRARSIERPNRIDLPYEPYLRNPSQLQHLYMRSVTG